MLYSKILQVSGPDAAKFLQGQLSCDVSQTPTYGAYCNIKGKVEYFFYLCCNNDVFSLSMPETMLESALAELNKYAVFSKVELKIEPSDIQRNPKMEIEKGIAEVYPETKGRFFPHDLNLPAIGAVSFNKGCYRGQEIVARMQHRGNLKRTLQPFTSTNSVLHPGDTVAVEKHGDGIVVRSIVEAEKSIGIAVVKEMVT